jgi:hypothetical protein
LMQNILKYIDVIRGVGVIDAREAQTLCNQTG